MGTRALIHVYDEEYNAIVTIYRHYDGYPQALGADIVEIISDKESGEITNSWKSDIGCLAAQLVAGLKNEPGNVYLIRPGSDDVGEEYVYKLKPGEGQLHIEVTDTNKVLFYDHAEDFKCWVDNGSRRKGLIAASEALGINSAQLQEALDDADL